MSSFFKFDRLFTDKGWLSPGYLEVSEVGEVIGTSEEKPAHAAKVEAVNGYGIPGFLNAHSHAFQYAMAGRAEKGGGVDDFWAWRQSMYNLALSISPKAVEGIAAKLYSEMLVNGYTGVAEFHYLHHQNDGSPYADPREMSLALIKAAKTAGIHLTLIPILYQKSGLGKPPTSSQRRFISRSLADYEALVDGLRRLVGPDLVLGSGVHSLRAVDPDIACHVLSQREKGPLHIHIAEQIKEIDEVSSYLGDRPVSWLLKQNLAFEHLNLVHATHLSKDELLDLANSPANVVLCPTTEANLGDGFFPIGDYLKAKGEIAIGSDSQVSLSPFEELRWLDYGARLKSQKRNCLDARDSEELGTLLVGASLRAGRKALGLTGNAADFVVLDQDHPALIARSSSESLSSAVYLGTSPLISKVMRRGKWVVEGGRHIKHNEVTQQFKESMTDLYQGR